MNSQGSGSRHILCIDLLPNTKVKVKYKDNDRQSQVKSNYMNILNCHSLMIIISVFSIICIEHGFFFSFMIIYLNNPKLYVLIYENLIQ